MKVMVVTGASSGIGRALAVRAARAGYAVYAVGRNREALAALADRIRAESGSIAIDAVDVAQPEHARGLVTRIVAAFGRIDVLVNNAGFVSAGPIASQSDAELQQQFGTHVIGPLALVREALDALRAAQGHVFMLGSGVARVPAGGLGAYPPAKAATRSATSILRRELRPLGIAVTYVDPGAVDTPFMKRAGMPGAPARLLVSPENVARKILIAVARRPRVVDAVPWQTALVALSELFPRLTDLVLERAPALVGGADAVPAIEPVKPAALPVPVPAPGMAATGFDAALEPHRRRMDKLRLSESFVRDLLIPESSLELGDVAMRWAGMPNKNERALTEDVLDALAAAGFLARAGEHRYLVLKAAADGAQPLDAQT